MTHKVTEHDLTRPAFGVRVSETAAILTENLFMNRVSVPIGHDWYTGRLREANENCGWYDRRDMIQQLAQYIESWVSFNLPPEQHYHDLRFGDVYSASWDFDIIPTVWTACWVDKSANDGRGAMMGAEDLKQYTAPQLLEVWFARAGEALRLHKSCAGEMEERGETLKGRR